MGAEIVETGKTSRVPVIRDEAGFIIAGGGGLLRRTLVRRSGSSVYVDTWDVSDRCGYQFAVVARNTEDHPQIFSEISTEYIQDDFYGEVGECHERVVRETSMA